MDERYGLPLPSTGDLDTANPKGNRPYGTLVEAKDLSGRFWGPREGSQSFTRVWEANAGGNGTLYDGITLLGTNGVTGVGRSYEQQFRDLGTTFTLDLWFRLDETAYAVSDDEIGLYSFSAGGIGTISVGIHGGTQGANAAKVLVGITTSTNRSTAASTVSFTSTNAISVGAEQDKKHHLRLVRDGADATLYVDGVDEGSTSNLIAANPINAALDASGSTNLGFSMTSDVAFKGPIFGAVLRDGVFDSLPIEAVMPHSPWAAGVHHYYLGRNLDLGGGEDHFFDAGRFAAHARLSAASSADWTITASNNDTAPAPAIVQGLHTWTTRSNRTATSVIAGGVLSTSIHS